MRTCEYIWWLWIFLMGFNVLWSIPMESHEHMSFHVVFNFLYKSLSYLNWFSTEFYAVQINFLNFMIFLRVRPRTWLFEPPALQIKPPTPNISQIWTTIQTDPAWAVLEFLGGIYKGFLTEGIRAKGIHVSCRYLKGIHKVLITPRAYSRYFYIFLFLLRVFGFGGLISRAGASKNQVQGGLLTIIHEHWEK